MKSFIIMPLFFFGITAFAQTERAKTDTLQKDTARLLTAVLVQGVINSKIRREQPVNISIVDTNHSTTVM
ncbi:MAG: hypothetical protein WKI04_06310 [Ferruginibacter sp.]